MKNCTFLVLKEINKVNFENLAVISFQRPSSFPHFFWGTSRGLGGLYRFHDNYKSTLGSFWECKAMFRQRLFFQLYKYVFSHHHNRAKNSPKNTPAELNSHARAVSHSFSFLLPLCTNRFVFNKRINPANLLICQLALCLSQHCLLAGADAVLMCTAVQWKLLRVMWECGQDLPLRGAGHGDCSSHRLLCLWSGCPHPSLTTARAMLEGRPARASDGR